MLGSKSTLQWVSSPNGPFILFPRGAKAEPVTNIEMGGDVLQGVQLGESSCVLLADGFETTWWNLPAWGGGIIVRCLWADSEDAVVHAVQNVEESDWSEENVVLDALDGALILSDLSGKSRDELEREARRKHVRYPAPSAARNLRTKPHDAVVGRDGHPFAFLLGCCVFVPITITLEG